MATGKVTVFYILKRQGKVFIIVVENTKSEILLSAIKKLSWATEVYTNIYHGYDTLDASKFHHEIKKY